MNLGRPKRLPLDHSPPVWDEHPEWFITLCCSIPGKNHLCTEEIGPKLVQAAAFFHDRRIWYAELFLLMPDHLHALVSIPFHHHLNDVIGRWKQWTARHLGIAWQKNFFDHRLRSYPSANSKFKYIEQNPVRAGLVHRPEDWPYVFRGSRRRKDSEVSAGQGPTSGRTASII
jgi:REP element-mobilizing transposase RayT